MYVYPGEGGRGPPGGKKRETDAFSEERERERMRGPSKADRLYAMALSADLRWNRKRGSSEEKEKKKDNGKQRRGGEGGREGQANKHQP